MMRKLFLVLAAWAAMLTAMSMKRITRITSGPDVGKVICCDSDHDSLPELSFETYDQNPPYAPRIEFWEYQGWNRFSLVFADTGEAPEPPGITTGNAIPLAAGDIDSDGLTDIVCITTEPDSSNPLIGYDDIITIESPDSFSYPCSLSWCYRFGDPFVIPIPTYYPPDIDGDGHREILCSTPTLGACIWENAGNDSNRMVWSNTACGGNFAFGDFDGDGKMEFATNWAHAEVWKCTGGDDQYSMVWRDSWSFLNGDDVFMTNDIDGDGLPEFYTAYEYIPSHMIYLYMWQADHVGSDVFRRALVDSVYFPGTDWGRGSECGDIDGDGIDECIWTTPNVIKMYKVIGNLEPREVWHWDNDHGGFRSLVSTVYDVNNDGYKELVTAGNGKISIFEIDAVDLVSPTHGLCKVSDTVPIRWATHSPPRCDSISLFLRRGVAPAPSPLPPPQGGGNKRGGEPRDSVWLLDTIAHGLPGTDTLYRWVVPSGVPDTGRIIVMAYGPGHQWDISDSAIHFTGSGVAEETRNLFVTRLRGCSPNPFARGTSIDYELANSGPVTLTVHDVSGRLVRRLESGPRQRGIHVVPWNGIDSRGRTVPDGVYFVRLSAGGVASTGRLTLVR